MFSMFLAGVCVLLFAQAALERRPVFSLFCAGSALFNLWVALS